MNRSQLRYFLSSISLAALLLSSGCQQLPSHQKATTAPLVSQVNPMIGTGGHGHTFPGATTPHGMVQLSPDTGIEGWDWCSGYHYSDSSIMGFSHTHLSGTGGGDYGDIMLMPFTGKNLWEAGTKAQPDAGYRSRFSHEDEHAEAGFYEVKLKDHHIDVALTATARTGFHQYTFPEGAERKVILDLVHGVGDNPRALTLKINSDHQVVGLRRSQGWAQDQYVYFVLEFNQPITHFLTNDGKNIGEQKQIEGKYAKAIFEFSPSDKPLLAKVALSQVSIEGAMKNLSAENNGWDFNAVKNQSQQQWQDALARTTVKGGSEDQKTIFYTAAYHTMMHPNIAMDVDGQYRGMDKKIYTAKDYTHYTLFSLWDTFRAAHPWYALTEPSRNTDFVKSMISKYDHSGALPIWELASNETGTMIGYHAVPVIADEILKGNTAIDAEKAFEAMKAAAMKTDRGLKYVQSLGYIPYDKEPNSVSKTVEYAYDDWCIAQVAKKLGKMDDYQTFTKRALNYQNLFDASTGFIRGRNEAGVWVKDFNPMAISLLGSGEYTEGNAWHYTFFAPQDINGLIKLYGGAQKFEDKLDRMWTQEAVNDNEHAHDVTGLIGQYAHGNEPSHHVAYLYNFVDAPSKTQFWVRKIMAEQYSNQADGLSGNEDCGQMSAWYNLSAMGLYPVNPASGRFIIGSPVFEEANIKLENGKSFTVVAKHNSAKNVYIQSAKLNGKPYRKSYIDYATITAGGTLTFEMGNQAADWFNEAPKSDIVHDYEGTLTRSNTLFMPHTRSDQRIFASELKVELNSFVDGATIYYTLDGSEPTIHSKKYQLPIHLTATTVLKAKCVKDQWADSPVMTAHFSKAFYHEKDRQFPRLTLKNPPTSKTYNPGHWALLDGTYASDNLRDGKWSGFSGHQLEATIDLGAVQNVGKVNTNFLLNTSSWVFLPKSYKVLYADDGKNWKLAGTQSLPVPSAHQPIGKHLFSINVEQQTRYIRVIAETAGKLPEWHPGFGNESWLFADEIVIESQGLMK